MVLSCQCFFVDPFSVGFDINYTVIFSNFAFIIVGNSCSYKNVNKKRFTEKGCLKHVINRFFVKLNKKIVFLLLSHGSLIFGCYINLYKLQFDEQDF